MQNSTYPLNYILLKQYLTILIYVFTHLGYPVYTRMKSALE